MRKIYFASFCLIIITNHAFCLKTNERSFCEFKKAKELTKNDTSVKKLIFTNSTDFVWDSVYFLSLPNLRELRVKNCNLKNIPSWLKKTQLEILEISGNNIEIVFLENFNNNQLTKLLLTQNNSKFIVDCETPNLSLEHLSLAENKIRKFDFICIYNLKNLKSLELSSNNITEFLGNNGKANKSIEKLDISDNLLSTFPKIIGYCCPNLVSLTIKRMLLKSDFHFVCTENVLNSLENLNLGRLKMDTLLLINGFEKLKKLIVDKAHHIDIYEKIKLEDIKLSNDFNTTFINLNTENLRTLEITKYYDFNFKDFSTLTKLEEIKINLIPEDTIAMENLLTMLGSNLGSRVKVYLLFEFDNTVLEKIKKSTSTSTLRKENIFVTIYEGELSKQVPINSL